MATATAIMTEEMVNETTDWQELYDAEYYTDRTYNTFLALGIDENYTEYGIKQNVEQWLDSKSGLMDILRKHPNWNEEAKAVILHTQEKRELSSALIWKLILQIANLQTWIELAPKFSHNTPQDMDTLYHFDYQQYVNEDLYNFFNENYPELHIHQGSKTSRALNKFFKFYHYDQCPSYPNLYAQLADALNPLTVEKTSILSVNFLDFMLMSKGNSWSSCHSIIPGGAYNGCYKAGCASYANDSVSMIYYTIDPAYDGDEYFVQPKITRQVFMYKDGTLVQDRLYPQCHDDDDCKSDNSLVKQYRLIVESIIAACLDKPNLWNVGSADIRQRENTYMYDDWACFPNWIYTLNDKSVSPVKFIIGGPTYCFNCGEVREGNANDAGSLYCPACNNFYQCPSCGRILDEDERVWVEDAEEYYCNQCVFYCEYHERYERCDDDAYYIRNYGDICRDAYENSNEFTYCDSCEEYYRISDCIYLIDGSIICEHCYDRMCTSCADCYESDYTENMVFDRETGNYYCHECAEAHIHEENIEIPSQSLEVQNLETGFACPAICIRLLESPDNGILCKTQLDSLVFTEMCKRDHYILEGNPDFENVVFRAESGHLYAGDLCCADALGLNITSLYLQPASSLPDITHIFGKRIAIVCDTEEKAKAFMKICTEAGVRWAGGNCPLDLTYWRHYEGAICYEIDKFKRMSYGDIHWFVRNYYTIMPFDDIQVNANKNGDVQILAFDINSIVGQDIVVHCATEEEADEFMRMCNEAGITWNDDTRTIDHNRWHNCETDTCYRIYEDKHMVYDSCQYYRAENCAIIPFADLRPLTYRRTA